jgi:RNA polymerase sigma-70 factor, ECF subfamily
MPHAVEQALELIRENQPGSIDRALTLLQNTVYSFSMKVCGHPQDAEDTMQEVLVKLLPYLPKFESPQALSVWLYKVARNRCISLHRRVASSPARNLSLDELMPHSQELQELLDTGVPNPEGALLNSESAEHLKQAVLAVPPQYRMVLVLHDMEDLSTAEVAKIMGLREGTVRVRLHRARLFLRQRLATMAERARGRGLTIPAAAEATRPQRCRRLFAALSDYMDGVIDNAMCDEMDRHLHDCEPCQAFLASLKSAVAQCHSYAPRCDELRAEALRKELLRKYQQAVASLSKTGGAGDATSLRESDAR